MVSLPFFNKPQSALPPSFYNSDAERQKRLQTYRRAWEAYLAELPDPLVKDGPANDNVKVNPVRASIEVGVYFLFGDDVRFQISPTGAQELGHLQKQTLLQNQAKALETPKRSPEQPSGDDKKPVYKPDDNEDPDKPSKQKLNPSLKSPESRGAPTRETPKWLIDLNKAWKANRKKSLLHQLGLSGGIHGDVFVKFVPRGAGINNEYPRLVILDPANVDTTTDPDDCTKVVEWRIEYTTEDENGKVVTRIQKITPFYEGSTDEPEVEEYSEDPMAIPKGWYIRNYEQSWSYESQSGWHPGVEREVQIGPTVTWPYSWPPIEHCSNIEIPHSFWGLPDVDDACVDVVQSIQRAMSSLNKIVRLHGSPRLFAKGVMPELSGEIDVSPDNVITLPAGAGMDTDLKAIESLTNVSSFVEFICKMKMQLLEMMRIPPIALGDYDPKSTAVSGINLSILYAPLLQRTELKRISYGDMLDRINHKLLVLLGHGDNDEIDELEVVWPEAMPGSTYLERQTLMEDIKAGLSNWTAMERLGYDPQKEWDQILEEKRAQMDLEQVYAERTAEVSAKFATQHAPPGVKPGASEKDGETRGGNNNPSGYGNRGGSMGATGNNTPADKNKAAKAPIRGGMGGDNSSKL